VDNVSKTILVADDDHTIRRLIRTDLEHAGVHRARCRARRRSSSAFKTTSLLLSDVLMPRMDGLQLADEVMTLRPELHILFISGNNQNCSHGFGCLAKPFTVQALLTRITKGASK
jgi:CheY-like chemotaxis protein